MTEPRDEDFSSLQTLLRLKRYETPPADSVEDFLSEFHRRQRAELLRRPLWRIALDRLESLFEVPTLATPRLAYAGSCAVALALAATGILSRGLVSTSADPTTTAVAAVSAKDTNTPTAVSTVDVPREHLALVASPSAARHASMGYSTAVPPNAADRAMVHFANTDADANEAAPRASRANHLRPRYVLESQPVRYAPRSSTF